MKFLLSMMVAAAAAQDARDIILKSAARDAQEQELRKNYTYLQKTVQRELDTRGAVKVTKASTHEVLVLYGRPYRRLLERDGKPLPHAEEAREKEKLERENAKRSKESDRDRAHWREEEDKRLAQEKKFRSEIADAFLFKMVGEETVSGKPAYVIQGDPKPGYRPRTTVGKVLPKVKGKVWITKDDLRWVKLQAEFIDTFSLGWMLLRVYPGTRVEFEARKVGDEVWMPEKAYLRGDARLALVKRMNLEVNVQWEGYRKFQVESRIVDR